MRGWRLVISVALEVWPPAGTGATAGGVAMKTRGTKTRLKRRKEPTASRGRGSSVADLQEQLDRQTRELAEARKQQAATSEVLRFISSSVTDIQPVFEIIGERAEKLCEAPALDRNLTPVRWRRKPTARIR